MGPIFLKSFPVWPYIFFLCVCLLVKNLLVGVGFPSFKTNQPGLRESHECRPRRVCGAQETTLSDESILSLHLCMGSGDEICAIEFVKQVLSPAELSCVPK